MISVPRGDERPGRFRLTVVALVILLVVASCATLEALGITPLRFSTPGDRSSELRLVGPSPARPTGGAALRIWARVENPNDIGLTLSSVAGDLIVADAEAIAVDFPIGLPLAARQDTVIPLDVSIGFDDLPRLGRIARATLGGERLDYQLEGSFEVDAGTLGKPRFGPLTLLRGELRVR